MEPVGTGTSATPPWPEDVAAEPEGTEVAGGPLVEGRVRDGVVVEVGTGALFAAGPLTTPAPDDPAPGGGAATVIVAPVLGTVTGTVVTGVVKVTPVVAGTLGTGKLGAATVTVVVTGTGSVVSGVVTVGTDTVTGGRVTVDRADPCGWLTASTFAAKKPVAATQASGSIARRLTTCSRRSTYHQLALPQPSLPAQYVATITCG